MACGLAEMKVHYLVVVMVDEMVEKLVAQLVVDWVPLKVVKSAAYLVMMLAGSKVV